MQILEEMVGLRIKATKNKRAATSGGLFVRI